MDKRIQRKNDLGDEIQNISNREATKIKISSKAKGQLGSGFTKLATPAQKLQGHGQTKAERSKVGSPWRPKGAK